MPAALLMACLAAGCTHTGFVRTTAAVGVPARSPNCALDVVFDGPPPSRYVVLGDIWTNWTAPRPLALGDSDVATMRRLTQQACAMGAHGLMNVLVIRRTPQGRGWKSTAATGEVFVYVDDSGRPLTPPDRTRILVPPGPRHLSEARSLRQSRHAEKRLAALAVPCP